MRMGVNLAAGHPRQHAFFADVDFAMLQCRRLTPPHRRTFQSNLDVSAYDEVSAEDEAGYGPDADRHVELPPGAFDTW